MRTVYIADDGKEFADEFECYDYEWKLNHQGLNEVEFYDKDGKRLENIMSEETYCKTVKIIAPTERAAYDLRKLGDYTGFCCYKDITCPGEWIFDEKKTTFILKE
jgi:hypothetical protein